jgi:hypothetical protein
MGMAICIQKKKKKTRERKKDLFSKPRKKYVRMIYDLVTNQPDPCGALFCFLVEKMHSCLMAHIDRYT